MHSEYNLKNRAELGKGVLCSSLFCMVEISYTHTNTHALDEKTVAQT